VSEVRAAAAVSHNHLARVYEVNHNGATYSVLEWNGGVSVADRLRAGDTLPVNEFLPNAAGLAEGLAELHRSGVVHGAIDPGAIQFSAAHPAKLGAFGRPHATATATERDDTRALATSLRQALTGTDAPDLLPSQVVEGIPRIVDEALAAAEAGALTAAQLAASLRSAPYRPEGSAEGGGWSWRWVVPAIVLLAAALLIAAAGLSIDVDPDSPFLFPATPQPIPASDPGNPADPGQGDSVVPPPPPAGDDAAVAVEATSFDPFGDNLEEREADVPLLHDDDPATAWRTERYFSQLSAIKPGVGVALTPAAPVRTMDITVPAGIDGWEIVSSGTLVSGTASVQLPTREGGVWLLWLTSLPSQGNGEFYAEIAEVALEP
jgi:hypothetical protein